MGDAIMSTPLSNIITGNISQETSEAMVAQLLELVFSLDMYCTAQKRKSGLVSTAHTCTILSWQPAYYSRSTVLTILVNPLEGHSAGSCSL